jgi:hypothetical protein
MGGLMRVAIILSLIAVISVDARAQTGMQKDPAARLMTVTAGAGNSMGGLGLQAERYIRQERFSFFGGIGYLPRENAADAGGVSLAAGMRLFTTAQTHRGFVEVAVSALAIDLNCFDDCHFHYGPGAQVGYQFVSRRGLTALASVGVGFAPGLEDGKIALLAGLGLGYTWRR